MMDTFRTNPFFFFCYMEIISATIQQPLHRNKTMELVHGCMGNRNNKESNQFLSLIVIPVYTLRLPYLGCKILDDH